MSYTINYTSNGLLEFRNDSRFAGIDGSGQSVAFIDTGIDLDHPGFGPDANNDGVGDQILRSDLDFTSRRNGVGDDLHNHGTSVAGIIDSIAPGVKLIPIQASTMWNTVDALRWIKSNSETYNINAINVSMGDNLNHMWDVVPNTVNTFYHALQAEVNELTTNKNVNYIASAGNGFTAYRAEGVSGLATYKKGIPVSNVDSNGLYQGNQLKDTSQRRWDTIGAPGNGLNTYSFGGGNRAFGGTSAAAPFMTGSVILLQGVAERYLNRELTPSEMEKIITDNADLVGTTGYKQINVYKAADAIYKMACPSTPTVSINGVSRPVTQYSGEQTTNGIVSSVNRELNLQGNTWQKAVIDYNVTSNTVLRFDFKANSIGEIQGISFDSNEIRWGNPSQWQEDFKVLGTENLGGNKIRYSSSLGQWQTIEIPVGNYFEGHRQYMVFMNDHDVLNANANSSFRNVQLFETTPVTNINGRNINLSNYRGSSNSNITSARPFSSTGDASNPQDSLLRLEGDIWKKGVIGYNFTPNTRIAFDYRSQHPRQPGFIHQGIAFDDDQNFYNNPRQWHETIRINGNGWIGKANDVQYSGNGQWQSFEISLGSRLTGYRENIVFFNEHDTGFYGPISQANSEFRNIRIFEQPVTSI